MASLSHTSTRFKSVLYLIAPSVFTRCADVPDGNKIEFVELNLTLVEPPPTIISFVVISVNKFLSTSVVFPAIISSSILT